jgi:hypothetical protein
MCTVASSSDEESFCFRNDSQNYSLMNFEAFLPTDSSSGIRELAASGPVF